MPHIVFESTPRLSAAIEAEPRPYWWQCCVLIEPFDKLDYLKTDSRG